MRLLSPQGISFSLTITGYEFPGEELGPTEENPADHYDRSRFLFVTAFFDTRQGSWKATAPEMTTNELEQLVVWLESIVAERPSANAVGFTERDLEFSWDESLKLLRVHAYCDFLPKWMAREDALTLDFPVSQLDLRKAISSLREELDRFPGLPPLNSNS